VSAFVVDNAHSPLGPSASERWLNCPGSVLLTKDMADPGSWFACEGTAAHTVSDWARRENRKAHDYIGRVLKVDDYEFVVDQEMADSVDDFVTTVEQIPGVPLYETRVHYDLWVPNGFGTLDDGRLNGAVAHITDFKHGKGVQVFAVDNSQLKLYAAGLLHDFGWLWPELNRFVLGIKQPRLRHEDQFEIKKSELLEWMRYEVQPIAERALLPGAPLKAGDHCQFCPAKRVCKVRADLVLKTVSGEFGDLDAPQNLAVLGNEDVAKILPHLDNVKKWCADVEKHALSQLAKGEAVGDWKVVEGRSVLVFSVPSEEVAKQLTPLLGDDLWTEPELISAPQARDKLKANLKGTLKGKARDEHVAKLLADITRKPRGKATLAPGSDSRPAIAVNLAEEFEDLDRE